MKKLLILLSSAALLPLASLLAQTPSTPAPQIIQPDAKLERYHTILRKRPSSTALFQKFQSAWLAQHNEASLHAYLENKATTGTAADKLLFAYLSLQQGKELQALKTLKSAAQQDPKNPQIYLDKAIIYARLLDYDKATIDIQKAITLSDKNATNDNFLITANKLKGRFLTRQGKTDQAVAHWNKLAKDNPNDQDLIEDVIDILMEDSLAPAALKLATTLRDNTKDPYKRALRSLRIGSILIKQGERDKALETYLTTLKSSGSNSWLEREIIAQIQTIYTQEDNTNGLIEQLQKLAKTYPQRNHIQLKLAETLVSTTQFDKAKSIYQSLIKTNPGDETLRAAYFAMLKVSRDFIAARQLIDSMIKTDPNNPQLQLQRASLSHQMQDKKSTLNDLNSYLKLAKPSPATATRYASLLNKYQFKKEAIAAYKKAHADFPKSLDTALNTAKFLHFNEQKDQALEIWKKLALAPQSKSDLVRILDALLFNNQPALALQAVKQHYPKNKTNISFLQAAIKVAETAKQYTLATDYSYTFLLLATNNTDIDTSVSAATRNIIKSNKTAEYIATLTKKQTPSLSEKFLLVNLQEQNGELKIANDLLAKLATSNHPIALLQAAKIYEKRYNLDKAAACLEKLITLPNSLKAVHLRQLSDIYKRAGKIDKALAIIQKWKTLAPNNKQVWIAEVNLLEDTQGPETALQTLRKGIQKFENDPEIFAKLADLNSQSNRHSQAKLLYWRLYDDAENLQDRIRWASLIAKTSVQEGTTSELIDKLNTRRRSSPQAIAPIMSLAEVYRVLDKTDELRKLLLEATRLRPEDPSLLLQIASIDEKNGDIKNAMETLRKAQKFEKNGNITRKLVKLMMEEGDYNSGLEELTKLKGKNTARTVESITLSLMQQDALEEAQDYLTKQLPHFPEDWRLLLLKSIIENNLGYSKQSFATALKLLSHKKKLTKLPPSWTAQFPAYSSALELSKLPPEYADFFLISEAIKSLNVLSNNSNNQYSYRTYAGAVSQSLPSDIRTLHLIAKAQIIQIISEFSDQELAPMIKEANASGFKHILLFKDIFSGINSRRGGENTSKVFQRHLKKQPDSKFIVNLAILSQIQQAKLTLDPKLLKQARKLNSGGKENYFSKTLPFFAPEGISPKEHTEQVVKIIKQDNNIEDQEIIYLFLLNRNMFRPNSDVSIDKSSLEIFKQYKKENAKEQQAASTQQLFANNSNNSNNQSNMLKMRILWSIDMIIQNDILKSDDYKKIIPTVEKMGATNLYSYYRSGRNQTKTLTFPTTELTTVNISQLSFFKTSLDDNDPFDRTTSLPKEKVGANLSLFKNPILKIVAAYYADESKDLSPLFKAAKAEEKYKADAHLLEAAYQVKTKKDLSTVLNSLDLARQNTTSKPQRLSINNFIFYAALASPPEAFKKLPPKLQELVQSTARRLMIQKKITEPESIKKALAHFSMEKETSRFLTKQNQSLRKANVAGRIIGNNPNTSSRTSRSTQRKELATKVKEAVQKKRTTYATNLLISKFKSILKSRYNSSYELKSWKNTVTANNLQSQVISKLDPKESISPKRWLNYYKAAEALQDKKAQAKAIKFLNNIPRVPNNVKAPLAFAIYRENPTKALELLKASRNPHETLEALRNQLGDEAKDPKNYTKTLSFTVNYLSSLSPNSTQALQIENHVNNTLREAIKIKRLQAKNQYNSYKKTKDNKLLEEQKQSFSKILNTALNYSPSADTAFILIQSLDPKKKSNQQKYTEIAKKSLLQTSKSKQQKKYSQYYGVSYGNNTKDLLSKKILSENLDRYQFISQEIIRTKNPEILDAAFLESIKDNAPKIYTRLQFLKENLLLDENALAKNIKKLGESDDFSIYLAWHEFLKQRKSAKVSALYSDQFLRLLLKTPTLKMDRGEINTFFTSQSEEFLTILRTSIPQISKAGKQKELLKLLDTLAEKEFRGVADKRKKWDNLRSTTSYSQEGYRRFILYKLMSALTSDLRTFRDAVPLINKYEFDITSSRNFSDDYTFPNPADLYAQFEEAGYLTTPAKLKLTKLPEVKSTKRGPNFPSTSNDNKKPKYDLHHFAKQYHELQYYNNNHVEFKKFIKLLKAAPATKQYGAQLTLVLLNQLPASTFLENNAKSFAKVPKQQREYLQDMLAINEKPELTAIIRKHQLESLFPVDKNVLKNKLKNDTDQILKVTIRNTNDLTSLERSLTTFLKKYLKEDIKICAKVFSHYISLLDKHRAINIQRFNLNTLSRSPLQEAVEKNVLRRLYIDIDTQHESLRLLYLLSKDPLSHKLGFRTMIQLTIPRNWPNKLDKRNYFNGQKLVLINSAKKYNALTDPDEKLFFRAAWSIYVYTNLPGTSIFFYHIQSSKDFYYLVKKHPETYELIIGIVNRAGLFQDIAVNNVIGHHACYHNDTELKLQWIKNYRLKLIPQLFKALNSYKPQMRAAVLSSMVEQIRFKGIFYQFPQFTDLYLDTLEKIFKEQPNLVCSFDTRYMLQQFKHQSLISSTQKQKARSLGSLIVNQQMEHLKNNNFIHHNHIINAACMLAIDKTGAEELIKIYRQNPTYFSGNVELAHILLRYGYLKEIKQILQNPSSRKYYHNPRIFADDDSDRNLTELLKLYKSNIQKAQVAGLLFLPNNYDLSKPSLMSPQQRLARLVDLVEKANKETKDPSTLDGAFTKIWQYLDIPTLKKMAPLYKNAELRTPKLLDTLFKDCITSNRLNTTKRYEYTTYLKYLILSGQHEKYIAQVKLVRSLYLNRRGAKLNLIKSDTIAITYEAVYAIMLEYYADPKKDQQLKELLPLIRKVNAITLTEKQQVHFYHYGYRKVFDPSGSSLLLSKFIHQELGEENAWTTWVNSLPPKLKRFTTTSGRYPPLCFIENVHILGDGLNNISYSHIALLQRIFNNKGYQHYSINNTTYNRGNINKLIEFGFIYHQQAEILLKKLQIKYHYPEFEAMMLRDANFIYTYTGEKQKIIENCKKIREILLKTKGPKEAKGTNDNLIDAMATLQVYNQHQDSLDCIPQDATNTFNNNQRKRYNKIHFRLCKTLKIKPNPLTVPKKKKQPVKKKPVKK